MPKLMPDESYKINFILNSVFNQELLEMFLNPVLLEKENTGEKFWHSAFFVREEISLKEDKTFSHKLSQFDVDITSGDPEKKHDVTYDTHYDKGHEYFLFKEGDPINKDSKIYFILKGKILGNRKSKGKTVFFENNTFKAVVGEFAINNSANRMATCYIRREDTPCILYSMTKESYDYFVYAKNIIGNILRKMILTAFSMKFNERTHMEKEKLEFKSHFDKVYNICLNFEKLLKNKIQNNEAISLELENIKKEYFELTKIMRDF